MKTIRIISFALAILAIALLNPTSAYAQAPALVPTPIRGDINGDGVVTAVDALAALSVVVGRELPAAYVALPNGDVDGNGQLTVRDAVVILTYSVGRDVSPFAVGQPLPGLTLSRAEVSLQVGDTAAVTAEVTGLGDSRVTWRSDTPGVATVTNGLITGVAAGQARITAISVADSSYRAQLSVLVTSAPVASISVEPARLELVQGDTARLLVTLLDRRGRALPAGRLVWTTSAPGIATVDSLGLVRGVSSGSARLTVASGSVAVEVPVVVHLGSQVVGPSGGIFVFGGGAVRFDVPAGALSSGTLITVSVADTVSAAGEVIPGTLFDFGPEGLRFRTPITVTIAFNPASLPSDVAPTSLSLFKWSGGVWQEIGGVVDPVAGRLTASLSGFSVYGMLPRPVALEVTPNRSELPVGATQEFKAVMRTASGRELTRRAVQWESSNPTALALSADGRATALAVGVARVIARSGALSGEAAVIVGGGGPMAVEIVGGAGQTGPAGRLLPEPLAVLVTRTGGTPAAGVNVVWSVAEGNGSISPQMVSTDARGIARAGAVLGTIAGQNRFIATIPSVGPVAFTANGIATPAAIAKVVPDTVTAGVATPHTLAVRVTDANGTPVPAQAVSWAVTGGAGSVAAASTLSNSEGLASVVWTLGPIVGSQTAVATLGTVTGSPLTFTVNAISTAATALSIATQPSDTVSSGSALARQPVIRLHDARGNAVSLAGVVVTAAVANGSARLTGTTTATTDSSGSAAFSGLRLAGSVGASTLSFSAPSLTGATSNTVHVVGGSAAQIQGAAGNAQSAVAGTAVPTLPAVRVTDADGNALQGVGVVFAITAGGGTLTGAAQTTGADGIATVGSWTLGTAHGVNTMTATTGTLASVTFTATGTPGAATQLTVTTQPSGTARSGVPISQQPIVQLRDAGGNDASQAGVQVTATIGTGGGSLAGTSTVTTGADGRAVFTDLVISGSVGARTLTFAAAGRSATSSSTINLTAGNATQLEIVTQPSANAQSGIALLQQPVIRLLDASSNPVAQSGISVTAAIASGGGAMGGTVTASTDSTGTATFSNLSIAGLAGARTLAFSSGTMTGATSAAISVTAGNATQLEIVTQPSASAQSGIALLQQPVIRLLDASSNPVAQSGITVTAAIASGGGAMGGTVTASTDSTGTATFSNLSIAGLAGARTLAFSSGSLTGAISAAISLTAGNATQLVIVTQPSASAQSGIALLQQPVIRLLDASSNPVAQSGISVTAAIASGGGAMGGTVTASTDSTGTATFSNLSIGGLAGARTLAFSSGTLTDATSAAISVTAGDATQLEIVTQPSANAQSGIALLQQPVIRLLDASSNPVAQSGISVTAAIASGGGAMGGTATASTDSTGTATFSNLSIGGLAGARTLAFSTGSLTGATSSIITLAAGVPTHLAITTQPSDSTASGAALSRQPVVQLQDSSGNAVATSGVSVAAALNGGGTLGGTASVTTNGSGQAIFSGLLITGTIGSRTLAFSSSGLTGTTSNSVELLAGAHAALSMVTQPSSNAEAGIAFQQQPSVRLIDSAGNSVSQSGVTVTASIASGGGSLGGSATATTNASGIATFTNLNIGGTTGSRTIAFGADGLTGATSGGVSVAAGTAASLSFTGQPANTVAGAAINPAVQVTVLDGFTNPVDGATVQMSLGNNPGSATLAGTTTRTTTAGVATFADLSVARQGTGYTLSATVSGLSSIASTAFNITHGPHAQFVVEAVDGGPIEAQTRAVAFDIRVVATDAHGNTVPTFTGNATLTSSPADSITAGTVSSPFIAGVLASHTLTMNMGTYTLTATAGGFSGTSNSFPVRRSPTAVNDVPAGSSAPGDALHAFYSTSASRVTFNLPAPGPLSNDNRGHLPAVITSFGADSLGLNVSGFAAGNTVSPLPGTGRTTGSLRVDPDGTIDFTPPDGFTGNYVFRYRLANALGTSDGRVTIAVGTRPAGFGEDYPIVLRPGVAHSSGSFSVLSNDTGDGLQARNSAGSTGGTGNVATNGTFTFTPTAGFEGIATLRYNVRNGFASTTPVAVSLMVDVEPTVSSTTPSASAMEIPSGSDIIVNFSEAVDVTAGSFTLLCAATPQPFTLSGSGTNAVTLNPNSDLPPGGSCTVTVVGAQVRDSDTRDGTDGDADRMAADHVFSFTVEF